MNLEDNLTLEDVQNVLPTSNNILEDSNSKVETYQALENLLISPISPSSNHEMKTEGDWTLDIESIADEINFENNADLEIQKSYEQEINNNSNDFMKTEANAMLETVNLNDISMSKMENKDNENVQSQTALKSEEEVMFQDTDPMEIQKSCEQINNSNDFMKTEANGTLETVDLNDIPMSKNIEMENQDNENVQSQNALKSEEKVMFQDNDPMETIHLSTLPLTSNKPEVTESVITEGKKSQLIEVDLENEQLIEVDLENEQLIEVDLENEELIVDLENEHLKDPIKDEVSLTLEGNNLSILPTPNNQLEQKQNHNFSKTQDVIFEEAASNEIDDRLKQKLCDFCSRKLFSRNKLDRKILHFTCNHWIEIHGYCLQTLIANRRSCQICDSTEQAKQYTHPNEQALYMIAENEETGQGKILINKPSMKKRELCLLVGTIVDFVVAFTSIGVGHVIKSSALSNLGIVEVFIGLILLILFIIVHEKEQQKLKLPFFIVPSEE